MRACGRDSMPTPTWPSSSREAVQFFSYSIYSSAAPVLVAGTNVLCVQAFNVQRADPDFRVAVELAGDVIDVKPPTIAQVLPLPAAPSRAQQCHRPIR